LGISSISAGDLQLDGTIIRPSGKVYKPPKKANPGNVIRCSGGHLGSKLAHENEAPFPEKLVEFFIKSFCPPEGIVLDPFCGSGTTCAVAKKLNKRYIGIDIRQSQIELTEERLTEETGAELVV
jgi:DNA modification methylase